MGLKLELFNEQGHPVPGDDGLLPGARFRLWVWNHLLTTWLRWKLMDTRLVQWWTRI